MDIAALSTSLAMSNLQTSWGVKMMGNAIDNAESQGTQVAQMIEALSPAQMELSVNPAVGSMFDASV